MVMAFGEKIGLKRLRSKGIEVKMDNRRAQIWVSVIL